MAVNKVTALIRSTVGIKNVADVQVNPARKEDVEALKAQFDSTFSRIKERRFLNTEEVRYDIPVSLINAAIYTGVATAGTATSASTWSIVRTDFNADKLPSRDRFLSGVAWDDRAAAGWP